MTTTNTTPGPRTRPLLIAATIPSLLSLAWTAWSVADMIPAPAPIAIAAGIALDIMLVAAVAIAWTSPAAARSAQAVSWVIAALAATAIGVHSWEITPALVLLAPLPLVAKALWGLALKAKGAQDEAARTAAEEQQRTEEQQRAEAERLSTDLTEEQQAELAELDRRRAYVESRSSRELALAEAEAQAAQQERLAQIRRDAEQQMATDEATAQIHVRRAELAQKIQLAAPVHAPVHTATQIGTGPQVPDDASGITDTNLHGPTTSVAGFGAVFANQANQGGAPPAPSADQQVPPHTPGSAPRGASPAEGALSGPQRLLDYVTQAGTEATVKGAARQMGVHPRTIRRYRERLAEAGHDVSALGTDPSRQ